MPKKIIMSEAIFNRTKNYILQRESRVNTSLQIMSERAEELIEAINDGYLEKYPNYCAQIERAINNLTNYFKERASL